MQLHNHSILFLSSFTSEGPSQELGNNHPVSALASCLFMTILQSLKILPSITSYAHMFLSLLIDSTSIFVFKSIKH
jgi:hypothetical protein